MEGGAYHGFRREWSESGVLILEEEWEFGVRLRGQALSEDGQLVETYELKPGEPYYKTLLTFRKLMGQKDK